jgi:hypothetical protein
MRRSGPMFRIDLLAWLLRLAGWRFQDLMSSGKADGMGLGKVAI